MDNRARDRILTAVFKGHITLGADWVYRHVNGRDVTDQVYAAVDEGLLELLRGRAAPTVTDAGRAHLNRPRQVNRATPPLFVTAGGQQSDTTGRSPA